MFEIPAEFLLLTLDFSLADILATGLPSTGIILNSGCVLGPTPKCLNMGGGYWS